jgi:hypothetical protein
MIYLKRLWVFLILANLSFACDDEDNFTESVPSDTILSLSSGMAIYKSAWNRIYYFAADLENPTFRELYTPNRGERIVWAKTGPEKEGATQLFALTRPKNERDATLDERLIRIPQDGSPTTSYTVGAQFDNLTFDPNKKFAVLYHGVENELNQQGIYNPNEIALIDLTQDPGDNNPLIMSVAVDGRRLRSIAFVPSVTIGSAERQLLVFMTEGAVRILDLDNPLGAVSPKIPLVVKNDPSTVVPVQVLARDEELPSADDTQGRAARLFVRSEGTEDVFSISLTMDTTLGGLRATIDQHESGGVPLDIAAVEDEEQPYLVILSRNGSQYKLNVVDIDTNSVFNIPLAHAATQILLRDGVDSKELVLYGNGSTGVSYLTVNGLGLEKENNLFDVSVPGNIDNVVELDANRLLLLPDNYQDLILMNLSTKKMTRLSSTGEHDWSQALVYGDRFFLLAPDNERVDFLDLVSEHPDTLLLDDRAVSLHFARGEKLGMVMHQTKSGRVTVFPLDNPTRSNAKVVDGLWLKDMLDREEVAE